MLQPVVEPHGHEPPRPANDAVAERPNVMRLSLDYPAPDAVSMVLSIALSSIRNEEHTTEALHERLAFPRSQLLQQHTIPAYVYPCRALLVVLVVHLRHLADLLRRTALMAFFRAFLSLAMRVQLSPLNRTSRIRMQEPAH